MRAGECLRRPVATGLFGCSVATESFLSRQRWPALCCDREFSVVTERPTRDRVPTARQKGSIVTCFTTFFVTTEKSLLATDFSKDSSCGRVFPIVTESAQSHVATQETQVSCVVTRHGAGLAKSAF